MTSLCEANDYLENSRTYVSAGLYGTGTIALGHCRQQSFVLSCICSTADLPTVISPTPSQADLVDYGSVADQYLNLPRLQRLVSSLTLCVTSSLNVNIHDSASEVWCGGDYAVCGIPDDYVTLFDTLDTTGCVWTYTEKNGNVRGPFICQVLFANQTCSVFLGTLNIFMTWQPQGPNPPAPVIHVQDYLQQLGLGSIQAVGNLQFSVFGSLPSTVSPSFLTSLRFVSSNFVISELNTTVRHVLLS